jgi:hypothetical protein
MAESGSGSNHNPLMAGFNSNATPFDMEAWFKCVEAHLEDAKEVKSKEMYNMVWGKLLVHIIEELAPVTDNPLLFEDPYT